MSLPTSMLDFKSEYKKAPAWQGLSRSRELVLGSWPTGGFVAGSNNVLDMQPWYGLIHA